jgi:hypothetical protein
MIKKGIVSSVDTINKTAKVTFKDLNNVVTSDLPYAPHVSLTIGKLVAVSFFSENLKDGLIISAF